MKKYTLLAATAVLFTSLATAQTTDDRPEIPAVYSNIHYDDDGKLFLNHNGKKIYEDETTSDYYLDRFKWAVTASDTGLSFDFGEDFKGKMFFGFIPYEDTKHPQPVFYGRPTLIKEGKCVIDIDGRLRGKYDAIGWEKSGKGTIGYRVMNNYGLIVYEGRASFTGKGPFKLAPTVVEGPFVNKVTPSEVTIYFETSTPLIASVKADGREFKDKEATTRHEITVTDLREASDYTYSIHYGDNMQAYEFKTSPKPGSRTKFSFAYASDSRGGPGGGERDIHGANHYMMKKIMAYSYYRNMAFAQFSGDLIDGYMDDIGETELQYANWKHSIESFSSYFPVYVSMGNHECLGRLFKGEGMRWGLMVDRFPFETESAEAIFGRNFVMPENGPASEDGTKYDPNPDKVDFPTYDENVYYYTYDNVAVVVLNSNYWYAPGSSQLKSTDGCLHAYIMDAQLKWLEETLNKFESDDNIDHVFVTQHTPFFPNGGHVGDDMWCNGNNAYRPVVAGTEVDEGIIERRDDLLDLLVNKSTKVKAILSGDEHNYAKTEIGPETNIYPEEWDKDKLELKRTIYQINNGAAGAPYYAQEQTPWTGKVTGFTTKNAVVFFHINGKVLTMEVVNPDTFEPVDSMEFK